MLIQWCYKCVKAITFHNISIIKSKRIFVPLTSSQHSKHAAVAMTTSADHGCRRLQGKVAVVTASTSGLVISFVDYIFRPQGPKIAPVMYIYPPRTENKTVCDIFRISTLTETWANEQVNDAEFHIPGFSMFRADSLEAMG